jgi:hypothetical protein
MSFHALGRGFKNCKNEALAEHTLGTANLQVFEWNLSVCSSPCVTVVVVIIIIIIIIITTTTKIIIGAESP